MSHGAGYCQPHPLVLLLIIEYGEIAMEVTREYLLYLNERLVSLKRDIEGLHADDVHMALMTMEGEIAVMRQNLLNLAEFIGRTYH